MLASLAFTLSPPGLIEFGDGALRRLPDAISLVGRSRAFIVTDPGIAASGILAQVTGVLTAAGVELEVFAGVEPNPSTVTVDRGAVQARAFGDAAVVAVGGGSSMDAAKGIALVTVSGGGAADFDPRALSAPAPPLIAVPTTAGTGAETNGFGVIEDTATRSKRYLGHSSVAPKISILDPRLTVGMPARVTASTGVDALVHGIESLTSRSRNPVSEAYAHQAIRLVHRWLPHAVADGNDLEARANMLLGSHLAGLALTISGLGLVHGIAHSVTAHAGAVHGVALSAVLAHVLEFNLSASTPEYAGMAFDLGCGLTEAGAAANSRSTVATVAALTRRVGTHASLRELGCTPEMVPALAGTALADPVTRNTPLIPSDEELQGLIHAAL